MPTTKNASVPEFCMSRTDEQGNNCNFCNGESEKKTSQTESAVKAQHTPPPKKKICLSMQKSILNREAEKKIKSPFEHRRYMRKTLLPTKFWKRFFSRFPSLPPAAARVWRASLVLCPSPFLSGKFICAAKKSAPPFGNERDYLFGKVSSGWDFTNL